MSIVSVKQIGAGRRGSGKLNGRAYTVVLQVIVNSAYDGIATVANASGIPARYAPYQGYENTDDPDALCVTVDPEQDGEEWQKWRVTCTFDTNWASGNSGTSSTQNNPEEDPPLFWVETEFVSKPVFKTWNGNDIKNAAGQLIQGLERIEACETWIWERNYTSLNRGFWLSYQNAVNSDDIFELDPKQGLLHIIVPKASYRNGVAYYRVQFRVRICKEKWTVNPADRGTLVKTSSGKLERPMTSATEAVDGEVPLRSNGSWETDATAAVRYIGEKDIYEPKPFDALGLT